MYVQTHLHADPTLAAIDLPVEVPRLVTGAEMLSVLREVSGRRIGSHRLREWTTRGVIGAVEYSGSHGAALYPVTDVLVGLCVLRWQSVLGGKSRLPFEAARVLRQRLLETPMCFSAVRVEVRTEDADPLVLSVDSVAVEELIAELRGLDQQRRERAA